MKQSAVDDYIISKHLHERILVSEGFIYMTYRTPFSCGIASSSPGKKPSSSQDLVHLHLHLNVYIMQGQNLSRAILFTRQRCQTVQVFSDKDNKPYAPSPVSSVLHDQQGKLKNPHTYRKQQGTFFPVLYMWSGLVSRVGASHRINLIAPLPLGQNCPRNITITMTKV